jgi:putative transposase
MGNYRLYNLSHCTYLCQYHLVWTPKYRGKVLASDFIKAEMKRMFKLICRWKGFEVRGWHIGDEHIHLYLVIPPKYSVSYAVSLLKGKSSSWIKKKMKSLPTGSFWCRGYFVSTIGLNEFAIRRYIQNQDKYRIKYETKKMDFPE